MNQQQPSPFDPRLIVFLAKSVQYILWTIVFAFGWALFVSPVFDMPILDLPQIIGAMMLLATGRWFFAAHFTSQVVAVDPLAMMKAAFTPPKKEEKSG